LKNEKKSFVYLKKLSSQKSKVYWLSIYLDNAKNSFSYFILIISIFLCMSNEIVTSVIFTSSKAISSFVHMKIKEISRKLHFDERKLLRHIKSFYHMSKVCIMHLTNWMYIHDCCKKKMQFLFRKSAISNEKSFNVRSWWKKKCQWHIILGK
jgi:hypothetical protein